MIILNFVSFLFFFLHIPSINYINNNKLYRACQVCTPNATNTVWSHCQCVLADGVERGILTANRMIPGPSIQVRNALQMYLGWVNLMKFHIDTMYLINRCVKMTKLSSMWKIIWKVWRWQSTGMVFINEVHNTTMVYRLLLNVQSNKEIHSGTTCKCFGVTFSNSNLYTSCVYNYNCLFLHCILFLYCTIF